MPLLSLFALGEYGEVSLVLHSFVPSFQVDWASLSLTRSIPEGFWGVVLGWETGG